MITIRIPAPSSMLLVNLLGLLGLIGVAVAVGGLTGDWWWTLAVLSAEAVFVSVIGAFNVEPNTARAEDSLAAVRPRAV